MLTNTGCSFMTSSYVQLFCLETITCVDEEHCIGQSRPGDHSGSGDCYEGTVVGITIVYAGQNDVNHLHWVLFLLWSMGKLFIFVSTTTRLSFASSASFNPMYIIAACFDKYYKIKVSYLPILRSAVLPGDNELCWYGW